MTSLKAGQKVIRETRSQIYSGGKNRIIVVTVHPTYCEYRLKGERQRYQLSHTKAMTLAVIADIEDHKRQSKNTRRVSAL